MKLLSLPSILGRSQRSLSSSKCSCIFLVQSHCLRANAIQSGGKLSKTLVEQENNSHACKLLTRTLTPTFSLLYILDLQRLGCTANDFRLQGKKYNSCDKQCYSCVLVAWWGKSNALEIVKYWTEFRLPKGKKTNRIILRRFVQPV